MGGEPQGMGASGLLVSFIRATHFVLRDESALIHLCSQTALKVSPDLS